MHTDAGRTDNVGSLERSLSVLNNHYLDVLRPTARYLRLFYVSHAHELYCKNNDLITSRRYLKNSDHYNNSENKTPVMPFNLNLSHMRSKKKQSQWRKNHHNIRQRCNVAFDLMVDFI